MLKCPLTGEVNPLSAVLLRLTFALSGLVEQNAAGAQWAIPTGTERGISVLNRIPVSVEARGGTSSTNLQSPEFYWFTELVVTLFNSFTS